MAIQPPPLDTRTYDDLVAQAESLVQRYTRDSLTPWAPNPPGSPLDPAQVMVRLFARMAAQVLERLNQVPEKNHLAFLDLLGAQLLPPEPARAPLTFHPVDGADLEPVVPAGTAVAAPSDGDLPESVFQTETEIILTRAKLMAAFVREPATDRFTDATAMATTEGAGAYHAFNGDTPVEHSLYLQCETLFTQRGGTWLTVSLTPATAADALTLAGFLTSASALWSYFDGSTWAPVPTGQVSVVVLAGVPLATITPPPPIQPTTVHGVTASFLRLSYTAPQSAAPKVSALLASISFTNRAGTIDVAAANSQPLDLTKDFSPFGGRPSFSDAFYLGSSTVFGTPNVTVTLTLALSDYLDATIAVLPLTLVWEVSTPTGWSKLTASGPAASLNAGGAVSFALPSQVAPMTVNGQSSNWVRVRVVNEPLPPTSFGATPASGSKPLKPPSFKPMTVAYSGVAVANVTAAFAVNDLNFVDWTPAASGAPANTIVPFVPVTNVNALYLGFDRAFSNRAETLFVQVNPPTPAEVALLEPPDVPPSSSSSSGSPAPPPGSGPARVIWEYSLSDGTWGQLGAADETKGFSRSGLVQFIGPTDFGATVEFGQSLFWIRARPAGTFAIPPKLSCVFTNTVWAANAATNTGEVLGTSSGDVSQVFSTSQAPVLLGQRIEVDEQQVPTPDEILLLADLDGPDVVTQVPETLGQPARIWVRWHPVTDFHASGPGDRHYVMDYLSGQVQFGDGANGRIPPPGRTIRAAVYRSGGGAAGNRDAGAIAQFKSSVPSVDTVSNPGPSGGGSDAETLEHLKDRSTTNVRHGDRAVTVQDFEDLAFEASMQVARAHAVPPTFNPLDLGIPIHGVGRVLLVIVPDSTEAQPAPGLELIDDVQTFLAARMAPSAQLIVAGPNWSQVTVTASIAPTSFLVEEQMRSDVAAAITRFLHPLTGGRTGAGWDFGRSPHLSDLYSLIEDVAGVDHIAALSINVSPPLDPDPSSRVTPTTLIYSGQHQITILPPPGAGG